MPEARYVRSLSSGEEKALRELYRRTKDADLRTRCQMILLSAQEYAVSEISELTLFNEDSVLYWLDRYERQGLSGLEDRPRSGRPPKSNWPMPIIREHLDVCPECCEEYEALLEVLNKSTKEE